MGCGSGPTSGVRAGAETRVLRALARHRWRPHLAQLHEQVGDPGLDALPEGVVLRPARVGVEGSARPAAPPSHRPAASPHSQAAALVGDEVGEVGQGEAVPEVEKRHDAGRPARRSAPLSLSGLSASVAWCPSPGLAPACLHQGPCGLLGAGFLFQHFKLLFSFHFLQKNLFTVTSKHYMYSTGYNSVYMYPFLRPPPL